MRERGEEKHGKKEENKGEKEEREEERKRKCTLVDDHVERRVGKLEVLDVHGEP